VKHRIHARCAQASRGLRTYPLRLRREILLLQGVKIIERSNTQKYLIYCRKECVHEFFQISIFQRKLRRVKTFGSTQREKKIENISQKLSPSERTLVHFAKVVKEGTSG
jgi:2-C-methyl-D-erythritol 4-phosphate cytidylyltransferase